MFRSRGASLQLLIGRESASLGKLPPFSTLTRPFHRRGLLRTGGVQRQIHRHHRLPLRQLPLFARFQQLPALLLPRCPDLRQEITSLIVVEHHMRLRHRLFPAADHRHRQRMRRTLALFPLDLEPTALHQLLPRYSRRRQTRTLLLLLRLTNKLFSDARGDRAAQQRRSCPGHFPRRPLHAHLPSRPAARSVRVARSAMPESRAGRASGRGGRARTEARKSVTWTRVGRVHESPETKFRKREYIAGNLRSSHSARVGETGRRGECVQ